MNLYEIKINSINDDPGYSVLVLSEEPLTKENVNINSIANIDLDWYYIASVSIPDIKINAWTAQEYDQATEIINNLIK